MKFPYVSILVVTSCLASLAQPPDSTNTTPANPPSDTRVKELQDSYSAMSKKMDAMNEVKISGYIQAQYQHLATDSDRTVSSAPVSSFAGGDFSPGITDRLMLRRAYLKSTYK